MENRGKPGTLIGLNIVNFTKSKGSNIMPKRTYQPKKLKRLKVHGFLKRMSSKGGKNVIKRRKQKGRVKVTA